MATLTLKGVPDALYRRLKRRAEAQRRSLNSEVIVCLERAVAAEPVNPAGLRAEIRAGRERLRLAPLRNADITLAKRTGRA